MERLTALLQSYSPGSDAMRSALEKAAISRIGSGPDGDVKVEAKSVAQHRPAKMEIRAPLDGKAIQIRMEYASLPDGPFYASAHGALGAEKGLTVQIDSFDYSVQPTPNSRNHAAATFWGNGA